MPQTDGLELLREIKLRHASIAVIIMTGYGTIKSAVQAIKDDATDYVTKPFNKEELLNAVKKVYQVWKLEREIEQLKRVVSDRLQLDGFIFKNAAMAEVYDRVSSAAKCSCSVLISGESGTGKELIARAVYRNSGRSDGPFVPINCSAISSNLIESELFGYRKGAFTGASRDYDGLFVAADGGTLFLDEIAEMPGATQAKLLRAVQEKSVRPVGALEERRVNVRFIAATNMKVKDALAKGLLREDLYHRLNVIQIDLPPLRRMREEIPDILEYFIGKKSTPNNSPVFTFDASAIERLETYSWPGNIRELENLVDRLLAQGVSDVVRVRDLPEDMIKASTRSGEDDDSIPSFSEAERELIVRALRESKGNKSRAAEILGISRPRLYKKIEEYGIKEV
jgi:DNA-binding NtrC family response regulator